MVNTYSDNKSSIFVTSEGVKKMLSGLKTGKASGLDQLRKEDLVIDIELSAKILTIIFQYSFGIGQLSDAWKTANVVPIFKKGSRDSSSNFRPVSLTCISCKLREHIVLGNIRHQLDTQLNSTQHSLLCTIQLFATVDDIIKMMEDNILVHAAILDFSEAFDKVPHGPLIAKLINTGIDTTIIKWIENFLFDGIRGSLLRECLPAV